MLFGKQDTLACVTLEVINILSTYCNHLSQLPSSPVLSPNTLTILIDCEYQTDGIVHCRGVVAKGQLKHKIFFITG